MLLSERDRAKLELLGEFVRREVVRQYKGSWLGVAWTVLNPVFMLAIYTVVFSVFLRFRVLGGGGMRYALMIFSGMVPFRMLADAMTRSTTCVTANVDLVKRVAFPAEVLPVSAALAAFVNGLFGLVVLLAMALAVEGGLHATLAFLPAVWAVQIVLAMAAAYVLSAAATLVRDVGALMPHLTMALMFLTPVVYPLEMLPAPYQKIEMLNPAAIIVLSHRQLIYGQMPPWGPLLGLGVVSAGLFYVGRRWFRAQRRFFPEVL